MVSANNTPAVICTGSLPAGEYTITWQGILKHLHILRDAGLVAVHQEGRDKRCTLTPEPLSELEWWTKGLNAKWDERLLRVKTLIENEQSLTDLKGSLKSWTAR